MDLEQKQTTQGLRAIIQYLCIKDLPSPSESDRLRDSKEKFVKQAFWTFHIYSVWISNHATNLRTGASLSLAVAAPIPSVSIGRRAGVDRIFVINGAAHR